MPLSHAGFCAAERASGAKILPLFVSRRHRRCARRVRRGIREHGRDPAAASAAPIAFSNLRLFDGKSDALIEGLRVVVEGKTIKSVEPAEAPLAPDARVVDCGGRVLMPGLIDAHWHAMMASLPINCLADGGCRLHHACRGRRSEKDADARLHQRPRHGRPNLQPETGDRQWPRARALASGRRAR